MPYHNPVVAGSFPDPFVLKHRAEYWAYGTGLWRDGRAFGVARSRDLVRWQPLAGALAPLPGSFPCYWAPEVHEEEGRFFLYYSVGDEETMEVRIAVAAHPAGPFADSGRRLTREPFAIDAHVFTDDDGSRWLFYATDFLAHTHVGTGTVRDRLLDPFTLAGDPRPVTRPRHDWQVYDPCRAAKGDVRWHTVEGPFVLKRKGRYYQMMSGGNWQQPTYGVSYAVAGRAELESGAEEWRQAADGERVLPILTTVPGRVVGPGHNSVVRGPDNRQLVCVYHRWDLDAGARVMAIDPLDWAGERMLVLGPSTEPQPDLPAPAVADFFDEARGGGLGEGWKVTGGEWSSGEREAVQRVAVGEGRARCRTGAPCFLAEVSLRAVEKDPGEGREEEDGGFGVSLEGLEGDALRFLVAPEDDEALVVWRGEGGVEERRLALPAGFDPRAWHLLRVEVDGPRVRLELGGAAARWAGRLDVPAERIALVTRGTSAAFSGFALTVGWEDLFEEGGDPAGLGWQGLAGEGWRLDGGELYGAVGEAPAVLAKGPLLDAYELVVNARLLEASAGGGYGVYPALGADLCHGESPLLALERTGQGWALAAHAGSAPRVFPLPDAFDPTTHQQLRFRKRADGRLTLQWERHPLGEIDVPPGPARVGLCVDRAVAAFEMVRVTALAG